MNIRAFDSGFYLEQNADVNDAILAGAFAPVPDGSVADQAAYHFEAFGQSEQRSPNAQFDEAFYLQNNPDVAEAVQSGTFPSGFAHFQTFGANEGRLPSQAFETFDEGAYLAGNEDVAAAIPEFFDSGLQHFMLFGSQEGRDAPGFDIRDGEPEDPGQEPDDGGEEPDVPDDEPDAPEPPTDVDNGEIFSAALWDKLADIEAGSWGRLNENSFSDVWPEDSLSAEFGSSPARVLHTWSSTAYDSNRGDLILWGGGHAIYSGNEVYRWDAGTMLWERASLPSAVVNLEDNPTGDSRVYETVDGVDHSPISSHTYDNNAFFPIADKYVNLGGAAYNTGGAFLKIEGDSVQKTGPYFWDPEKADPDKVGGLTGSHVNPEDNPDILGGEMWENRESLPGDFRSFVNGVSDYAEEDGKDVLYVADKPGNNQSKLWKYTAHDVDDPSQDTWEVVGRMGDSHSNSGAGAVAPDQEIFVRTAGNQFTFWDLSQAGPQNGNQHFTPNDPTGEFQLNSRWGMEFDSHREQFVLWGGNEEVWALTPPETIGTEGWELERISMDIVGEAPSESDGILSVGRFDVPFRGVHGKWEYVEDLDVFLGVIDPVAGDIWAFKPEDWQHDSLIA